MNAYLVRCSRPNKWEGNLQRTASFKHKAPRKTNITHAQKAPAYGQQVTKLFIHLQNITIEPFLSGFV